MARFEMSNHPLSWFDYQYRSLIRATHTHVELDEARLVEESMLPRDAGDPGQEDVRETPARMDPWCPEDRVGYLPDATDELTDPGGS